METRHVPGGLTNSAFIQTVGVMVMLASGFIVTAMLWGAAVAFLTDRRPTAASLTLVICGLLSLVGFIHSVLPSGGICLPRRVATDLPWHWSAAYASLALVVVGLHRTQAFRQSVPAEPNDVGAGRDSGGP